MGLGVADEMGFGSESEQGLYHRQGDQLRVGQLGGDAYLGSRGRPVGVVDQQVIDSRVECSSEGVQIRVHAGPPGFGKVYTPGSWTPLPPERGITRHTPWNYSSSYAGSGIKAAIELPVKRVSNQAITKEQALYPFNESIL